MLLFERKAVIVFITLLIGASFVLNSCAPRSRIRHAKIGDELEDETPAAEQPVAPPPAVEVAAVPTIAPTVAAPPAIEVQAPPEVAVPATATPVPTSTPVPTATAVPVRVVDSAKSRMIVKGDTLWDISAEKDVYGNAFLWPLIFRSNRSRILDPDLIYPRQELKLAKNYSDSVMAKAMDNASKTPPYKPHRKPRRKLPISY